MKPVQNAFAAAIERAEKSMGQSKSRTRADTPKKRGHAVTKLSEARVKKRKAEARSFTQQARTIGLDGDTLAKIDAAAKFHAQSTETWIFVMMSAAQNVEVIDWLQKHSSQPHKAVMLWATLLTHLRMDTGEIMATRQRLSERIGIEPRHISSIITELASINAIRREKDGRRVKYFLNPNIATHLPSTAARTAAREKAGPLLKLMESGRDVVAD